MPPPATLDGPAVGAADPSRTFRGTPAPLPRGQGREGSPTLGRCRRILFERATRGRLHLPRGWRRADDAPHEESSTSGLLPLGAVDSSSSAPGARTGSLEPPPPSRIPALRQRAASPGPSRVPGFGRVKSNMAASRGASPPPRRRTEVTECAYRVLAVPRRPGSGQGPCRSSLTPQTSGAGFLFSNGKDAASPSSSSGAMGAGLANGAFLHRVPFVRRSGRGPRRRERRLVRSSRPPQPRGSRNRSTPRPSAALLREITEAIPRFPVVTVLSRDSFDGDSAFWGRTAAVASAKQAIAATRAAQRDQVRPPSPRGSRRYELRLGPRPPIRHGVRLIPGPSAIVDRGGTVFRTGGKAALLSRRPGKTSVR